MAFVRSVLGEKSKLKLIQLALHIKNYLPKFERFQLGIKAQNELFWLDFTNNGRTLDRRKGRSP
jgi:hypothetical protein